MVTFLLACMLNYKKWHQQQHRQHVAATSSYSQVGCVTFSRKAVVGLHAVLEEVAPAAAQAACGSDFQLLAGR
jgi:hypothetical protein